MAREPGLTRAQRRETYFSGLRSSIYHLAHHSVPAVQSAFGDTLQMGTRPTPGEAREHRKYIFQNVTEGAVFGSPSWLSHEGLMAATFELSSSAFWQKLITPTTLPDHIHEKVTVHFDDRRDTAQLISGTNAHFMSSTIYTSMLAVAEGETAKRRRLSPRIFPLVQALTDRFPKPALDTDEFIGRMQELVPNPGNLTQPTEPTLIDYFRQYEVFRTVTNKGGVLKCPAILFTDILMQKWGKMFDDLVYRSRFAGMVTKSEDNKSVAIWSGKKKKRR